jgi:ribosomal protein L24E
VYKGFQGHMLASPPASFPEMFPLVLYLLPPPVEVESEPRNGTINVTSNAEMTTITSVAGKTIEAGTGHLFITANNCQGQRAAGVSFKVDIISPTTGTFYVGDNGLPSQTLASTANRGEGAIINVPTGFVTLTAVSEEAGKIAQITLVVVADHIIGVPVVPTPL